MAAFLTAAGLLLLCIAVLLLIRAVDSVWLGGPSVERSHRTAELARMRESAIRTYHLGQLPRE